MATVAFTAPRLSRPSLPIGLRYEWLAEIPGVNRLVAMEATHRAIADRDAGMSLLLSYGRGGTFVPGVDGCAMTRYDRRRYRESDVPAWADRALKGTMTLECRKTNGEWADLTFTVIEMGCLGWGSFWAMHYNRAMISGLQ